MKKRLLAIILFFTFTSLSAQWTTLGPFTANYVEHCSFPSDDTGYATAGGKIYRTFNGGASFDSITIPNAAVFYSIDFLNNLDGVVAADLATTGNLIYRTVNAGATWQDISPPPFQGQGVNVKFADALHGTYLISAPYIFNTANGGITWDTVSFGYDYFGTVAYPTATTGYIGGFDGTFNYKGVICKTSDGGATWNVVTNLTSVNSLIKHIQFTSADTGFACFTPYNQSGRLMRTRDGAASWDTVYFNHGGIVKFAFSDYMNGFIVNDSGSIYRTNNAGITWTIDRLQTDYLLDIAVTENFAYSVGYHGLVLKRNLTAGIPAYTTGSELKIYPNPGADRVTVQLPHETTVTAVSAMDVTGRKCGNLTFTRSSNDELMLDTQSLAKGCYVLEIITPGNVLNVKFEKAK